MASINDNEMFAKIAKAMKYFEINGKQCIAVPYLNDIIDTRQRTLIDLRHLEISGLSLGITPKQIDEKFQEVLGDDYVLIAELDQRHHRRGCAFVTFKSNEYVELAIKKANEGLFNFDIWPISNHRKILRNVYIENFPSHWTKERIQEIFSKYGNIKEVVVSIGCSLTGDFPMDRLYAFVSYEDKDDEEYAHKCAQNAILGENLEEYEGFNLYVRDIDNPPKLKEEELRIYRENQRKCYFYVMNYPDDISEEQLNIEFGKYYEIDRIELNLKYGNEVYAKISSMMKPTLTNYISQNNQLDQPLTIPAIISQSQDQNQKLMKKDLWIRINYSRNELSHRPFDVFHVGMLLYRHVVQIAAEELAFKITCILMLQSGHKRQSYLQDYTKLQESVNKAVTLLQSIDMQDKTQVINFQENLMGQIRVYQKDYILRNTQHQFILSKLGEEKQHQDSQGIMYDMPPKEVIQQVPIPTNQIIPPHILEYNQIGVAKVLPYVNTLSPETREIVGEFIYLHVEKIVGQDLAPKITGILLISPIDEMIAYPPQTTPSPVNQILPPHILVYNQTGMSKVLPLVTISNPNYKSQVGEFIYEHVESLVGEDLAPKITGMLIDFPITEIQAYVSDFMKLKIKINEASTLLKNHLQK
eukprot:403352648